VLSQILFYSSPVIIPAETVREKLAHGATNHFLYHLYTLNPLVAIFQQFRHAMVNHATLSAGQVMGSWAALLEPMALVAGIIVLGFWVFNREAPHIAEDL
jgi:ABC-2 type transport system permease protein